MTTRHLEAALRYAELGWPVLPLRWHGKTPWGRSHGVHDATCDEATIRAWFARCPEANLGICPGGIPALVLDIDPRHNGDETLRMILAAGHELPETPTCRTGGGGLHYYFAPLDFKPTTTAGEGLDIRAGFNPACVPPSIHASGNRYRWEVSPTRLPLAPAPGWLVERITPAPVGPRPAPVFRDDGDAFERGKAYLRACPSAAEGERDRTVFLRACRLWELAPQLGADGIAALLVPWDAVCCFPPLGERVVRQKVLSAARRVGGAA